MGTYMKFYSARTTQFAIWSAVVCAAGAALILTNLLYANNHAHRYMLAIVIAFTTGAWVLGNQNGRLHQQSISSDQQALQSNSNFGAIETNQEIQIVSQIGEGWDGGFDECGPKYPAELDIALQAWRAVSNKTSSAPIRDQLGTWLKTSYPDLSSAACERIIGVCNWDKSGGRPKIAQ